jgi:GNAT superfamily N-acetyltransferase
MNEQAIKDSYELFKSGGYSKSIDEFKSLIASNPQALNDSYELFKSGGYSKDFDSYKALMGLTAQPVPAQLDKKKVATALPSAASSSESVSTRPTEPTIATRKPQTTSFGTYGVSKPQPSTAAFTKPVAPEPESILGPVEKDVSVKRDISVNPKPMPAVAPKTTEVSNYFDKSLDIINEDLMNSEESMVVPKLNYTFGQYGFKFSEAGPMFDEVKVISPNGKEEVFSLDNWFSSSSSEEATRFKKFISENKPTSKLLEAREGQYAKPILSEEQSKENILKINADTESLSKDISEYTRLENELNARLKNIESLTPEQKTALLQSTSALELKRLEVIRKGEDIQSRTKMLNQELGNYSKMKAEQGTPIGALWNSVFVNGIGGAVSGLLRTLGTAQSFGNPAMETAMKAAIKRGDFNKPRELLQATIGAESTSKEYIEDVKQKSFLGGAVLGVAESLPAMLAGPASLPALMSQGADVVYQEIDKNPDAQDMPEWKKALFATTIGAVAGYLENLGFSNAIGQKGLLNGLVAKFFARGATNVSGKAFNEFVDQEVKSLIAKGVLRTTAGGLAEAETGVLQEISDVGLKEVFNAIEGNKTFETPESAGQFALQVLEAGASEAVGGIIMNSVGAVSKGYQENKFDNLLDEQVSLLNQISSDPTFIDSYKLKIKEAVAEGKMTTEEGEKQKASFDKMIGQLRSIPSDISPAGQKEALRLLKERDALQAKIDSSDPDLVTREKARVAEIKEKLNKISEDYAVQKPSTEESVLRDEESQVGLQEMGEGNAKGQAAPQEDKAYVTAQEVNDNVAKANPDASVLLTPDGDNLSLTAVYVGKENRGKGIGTNVLNTVKSEADRVGKKIVLDATNELDSETDLERLGNFYERNGFKRVGENKFEYAPQETIVKEEVTAEPLEQKSSRLLDAIDTARQAGANGVDALNSALANLRGIASERVKQIGNRIDDLQQKVRDLTKSSTVPSATLSDLAGTQVNYNGESGTLNVSEGGAVTFETPNQIIEIENATPTSMASDFNIAAPKPAMEITPTTDRFIDNDNVVINNVEYGIQADNNGNVVGLQLKDGSNQVLTNPQLLVKAEAIRNTEGKVAITTETTITPEAKSQIDALNGQIDALTNERGRIEQATAEPVTAEAMPTAAEKRFAGNVLAATRVAAEDLGKLVAILTKANKNVKVVTDKAKMVAFLVKKGLSPEQANQVKGVRVGDTVYINPDLATVDTPIHEFAHIWGELCKKQRPELWKRGLSLITKSNYYKDLLAKIKADPNMSKLYPTPEAIKEEALIQAIGERGAVIFDDNKLQLLWNNWVAAFDNFVKKLLGLPMTADITKIKLSEFLDMAATEVLTGKGTGVGGEMTIEKTKAAKDFEFQVDAWHGSPHRFDKFSLSKMGTGEGVQAFGWGLYFTDLKNIAEGYAKNLSQTTFDGKPLDELDFFENLLGSLDAESDEFYNLDKGTITNLKKFKAYIDNSVEELQQDILKINKDNVKYQNLADKYSYQDVSKDKLKADIEIYNHFKQVANASLDKEDMVNKALPTFKAKADAARKMIMEINKGKSNRENILQSILDYDYRRANSTLNYYKYIKNNFDKFNLSRNLYKVSLHEGKTPDQYAFLEWDKPMSDRALGLFQKFNKEQGIKLSEPTEAVAKEDRMTVGQMYKFISDKIGQKEASLFLLENGIDGIKYPAESISRGATSDTARGFNYVVFDENAVKIQEAIQFQAQQSANDLAKIVNDAIKAKLTKTQIVDILVKRGGLTAADANQVYNDVKAKNPISIATTGTTPAATTTTVKPKSKFVDNIANAIEQMAGGNVTPEVKDAIVKEINTARQAIKKALMSEMALKKQLASIVKSLGVSNKITATQAKSIITAFSKVNVMSDSSVNNFIDKVMDIFDKVNAKTEAENRSSLISSIADLAKKAARSAVTSTGKSRAKSLDAVGQSFFRQVSKIVTLAANNDINGMAVISNDLANAQNEINDAVQKELNGEQLTAAESDLLDLVYAFDAFGDILNMSEQELQALLDDLKNAKSTSIQSMKAFRHKQALQKKAIVDATDNKVKQLNPAMFNADGSLKGEEQRKQNRKEIRNELNKGKVFKAMKMYINSFDLKGINGAIRTLANTIQNIETLATILGKGKDKFFIKNIYDKLFVAEEKQRKGYQKNMKLMETLAKSVGFKNFDALVDALTTGRQYEFEVNGQKSFYDKDELIRMYALSKNGEQRAKLKKQGIDDNALAEIKTILGPQLISFADKVVDYLSTTYYDETNSVYVSEYNTRLPRIENYFPTITERTDTTADILSGDLSRIFMADTASALKQRVDKNSDIILSFGFINALEGHFQQIERFKAYAPTVREVNSTFSSPAFSAYLDETGTKKLFKFLVSNAISPDAGNPFPTTKSSIFDKYAGYALAFKLIQIPKQAVSAVFAFEDYQFRLGKYTPSVDLIMFIKDLTTVIATLPKQIKKFRDISASFNERYVEGMKGNVISTTSGRGGLRSLKQRSNIVSKLYRKIMALGSLPTTFGDILSVAGYMAVYNRNIKNGMDPEQAAIQFNNYNKTLQSRNAVDRTALQNNKEPLLKVFTMFGSSAFLQMNKVMQSSSAIVSKSAEYVKTRDVSKLPTVKEYRAFILNLGVANALFAWASYAFKIMLGDDEDREKAYDEMLKAMLGLNLLYQLPLLGDAIELVNAAIDGDELSLKGTSLNPYTTIAVKAIKGIKNDDYTAAAKPILELVAGMSFDPFIGLYEIFEDSLPTDESAYKLFGISKTYQPESNELTQSEIEAMEAEDKKEMKEFDPFLYESIYGEQEREEKRIKEEQKALEKLYGEEEEED